MLSSGLNDVNRVARVLVHVDNWLTRPMKERKSDRFAGMGYLVMASVIAGSILYPLDES